MRKVLAGLSSVLLVVAAVVALAAPANADDQSDEWQFVTLINQARSDAGLPALGVLSGLRDIARAQSIRMAQQNLLYHTTDLVAQVAAAYPDWQRLGENVGEGWGIDGLHQAFMNSPGHRDNILGDYNYMAIGVVHANGYTWVTEEFLKATPGKATLSPPLPEPPIPVIRIAGPTSSDTWLAVSGQFPAGQSDGVVIGRSDVFADALAGGPLAAILHGPMLLTPPDSPAPGLVEEARRVLRPGGKAELLGGPAAISPSIEQALLAAGIPVERLAGIDRYATAVAIAARVNSKPSSVLIVSGTNFADAMVAGPVGAIEQAPIVLAAPDGLSPATAQYLASVPDARRIVIGGPAAVSDAEATAAGADARVAGADRYETSVRVAQTFFPSTAWVSFATGTAFTDALAGAAWIARAGDPLLLVSPSPTAASKSYVQGRVGDLDGALVFGSAAALPDSTIASLFF